MLENKVRNKVGINTQICIKIPTLVASQHGMMSFYLIIHCSVYGSERVYSVYIEIVLYFFPGYLFRD